MEANFDSEAIEVVKFFDKNFPVFQNVIPESIKIISSIDFSDSLQKRKNHILTILRLMNEVPYDKRDNNKYSLKFSGNPIL